MSAGNAQPNPIASQFVETLKGVGAFLPEDKKYLMKILLGNAAKDMQNDDVGSDERFPGFRFSPNVNPDVVAYVQEHWAPNKEDVLVASFPKTGTTWTREIVRRLLYKDNPEHYKISKACELPPLGYLESSSTAKFEISKGFPMKRLLWGTPLPAYMLNMDTMLASGAKMIYVVRNPKDTLVSCHNFFRKLPWADKPKLKKYIPDDFEQFVRMTTSGVSMNQTNKGTWYPDHIRSYYKHHGHPNILFLTYEGLKQDSRGEIAKIADFIGVKLTDKELDEVVEKTTFDSMKKQQSDSTKLVNMFRKGGVGNWKTHFTVELSEHVDAVFNKDMGDLNIDFKYTL